MRPCLLDPISGFQLQFLILPRAHHCNAHKLCNDYWALHVHLHTVMNGEYSLTSVAPGVDIGQLARSSKTCAIPMTSGPFHLCDSVLQDWSPASSELCVIHLAPHQHPGRGPFLADEDPEVQRGSVTRPSLYSHLNQSPFSLHCTLGLLSLTARVLETCPHLILLPYSDIFCS